MAPKRYENHVFSLPSAFNSFQPQPQNPATTSTYNLVEGSPVLQNPRQRVNVNTMPWNQGPISLTSLSESKQSSSSAHPDFRRGLPTPRTPFNSFSEAMDVDFSNAQRNTNLDSGGDWDIDGYLLCLNNVHITVFNK
jgi:hypothetical protein